MRIEATRAHICLCSHICVLPYLFWWHPFSPPICFYIRHFGIRVVLNQVLGQSFPSISINVWMYMYIYRQCEEQTWVRFLGNQLVPECGIFRPGFRPSLCKHSAAHTSCYYLYGRVSSAAHCLSAPHYIVIRECFRLVSTSLSQLN